MSTKAQPAPSTPKMSDINVNTPTDQAAEHVEVAGGEFISFDDLEMATMQASKSKAGKSSDEDEQEEAPRRKSEREPGDKSIDEDESADEESEKDSKKDRAKKPKDADDESEEEESEDDVKEKLGKAKKGKDAEADEDAEKDIHKEDLAKDSEKGKLVKVKQGDKELELATDAEVPVKINGKTEMVKLADLQSNYSGKVVYDKKFKELDTDRKAFEKEVAPVKSFVEGVFERVTAKKDPVETINFILDKLKIDGSEFWHKTTETVATRLQKLSEMTDEERKAYVLEEENATLKQKESVREKTDREKQAYTALEAQVKTLQETHGVDDKALVDLYDEILTSDIVKSGRLKAESVTPEMVFEYHQEKQARAAIGSILDEAAGDDMSGDARDAAIEKLRDAMLRNDLSFEELQEIAVEVYGNKSAKTLAKKLKKSQPTNTSQPAKERRSDPVSFDDLG